MVLSKNEWVKFFESYCIMLIFINPKSEYRNPKQYLNTKFKIQNKYIAMYLQIVTSIFEKQFSLLRVFKCIKN